MTLAASERSPWRCPPRTWTTKRSTPCSWADHSARSSYVSVRPAQQTRGLAAIIEALGSRQVAPNWDVRISMRGQLQGGDGRKRARRGDEEHFMTAVFGLERQLAGARP